MAQSDPLAGWYRHGVSKDGKFTADGEEYYTECFFCSNKDGFYINGKKQVFMCQACGEAGNYFAFLKKVHALNKEAIQEYHYAALAEDRGLPKEVFRKVDFGVSPMGFYTFPVLGVDGSLIGLDMYQTGKDTDGKSNKVYHSPSPAQISLYNAEKLKDHLEGPIYITEGFWDGLAFEWLLEETKDPGLVVSLPGALINIGPWEHFFYNKDVIVLFDHDKAGRDGEMKIYRALMDKVRSFSFLRWPKEKPAGYDIRDHVIKWCVKKSEFVKALKYINGWLYDLPRELLEENKVNKNGIVQTGQREEDLVPISWDDMITAYHDLLYMPDISGIRVLLGTILANRYRGEMIWMFLVAPPGCGKSELIMSLGGSREVHEVSMVSEKTFVSGFGGVGEADPSLFVKLNKRNMAVKDFTPLLQTDEEKQKKVFGTLRDAYDGKVVVEYGNRITRKYENLHFGIIGGVTNVVEQFGKLQQALGERFLRYYLPLSDKDAKNIEKKANDNITEGAKKRGILQLAVARFLAHNKTTVQVQCSEKYVSLINNLARFTVAMRTTVPKDFKERMLYTPSNEGPSRVFKQLRVLSMGLCRLENKTEVGEDELKILKDVAVSTCPDIVKKTVKALYDSQTPMGLYNLEEITGFDTFTLKYYMNDLKIIHMVNRIGAGMKIYYQLSDKAKTLISDAQIYGVPKKKFFIGSMNPLSNGHGLSLPPRPAPKSRLPSAE